MISATDKTIVARILEIILETVVYLRTALGGLDHHKANRAMLYLGIAEFLPIDLPLVMTDVDTTYLVALRILGIPIEGTPTESERTDKEMVEHPDIKTDDADTTQPPRPTGIGRTFPFLLACVAV